ITGVYLPVYCIAFIEHLCPSSHFYLQKDGEQWELIGSRTYKWNGSEALRCKHWDKVAVRWHLSTCEWRNGRRSCNGGTNADLARDPQTHSEFPRWRNAFTYAQLPNSNHAITIFFNSLELCHCSSKKHQHLRLGLEGYDKKMFEVKLVTPLKIDVDWKWTIGVDGCNNFSVRMSAMSTIDERRLTELTEFCRSFDTDGFVSCINL
uniref:C-type lectin domain-containing protein n=1 Tax=Angiostrongylus cantonensis TaxID=6313 RepID=A0A0K0DAP9_ANGCA